MNAHTPPLERHAGYRLSRRLARLLATFTALSLLYCAPCFASDAAAPSGTYTPKAGETLDQVIGKTMADSPLSMALLRQAFIDENPQAIVAGKVPKLRKGMALHIPNHDLLLRRVLSSVTPVPAAKTAEAPVRALPASPEERKRWVQFP